MKRVNSRKEQTEKLVLMALLAALVAVLSYLGGFIRIGSLASINLTLVPVVIGGALFGPIAGAMLGAVSAVIFFFTTDALFWFGLSIPGTIITVMTKGIMAGLCAGSVYKLLEKVSRYFAVVVSAIVCPVVNTGIFIGGCLIFFMDNVKTGADKKGVSVAAFLILFYVGLNFVFELVANVILGPAMYRLINIRKKS